MVHLSANCLLLLPEDIAREMYNTYSTTLRESMLIKGIAYMLYLSIILHVVYALIVTYKNKKAKPEKYAVNYTQKNSTWSSQNMGFLGILILLFLVVHLANFWARIKLGVGEAIEMDGLGNIDVYGVTSSLFHNIYYVLFYSILSIPLSFHLQHGLKSAFKSLGFYHRKGLRVLSKISLVYAAIIAIGFGIIPLVLYFK